MKKSMMLPKKQSIKAWKDIDKLELVNPCVQVTIERKTVTFGIQATVTVSCDVDMEDAEVYDILMKAAQYWNQEVVKLGMKPPR